MPVALPQKNLRAACPLLVLALWFALLAPIGAAEKQRPLELHLRSKVETSAASGRYHTLTQPATWDAGQTAVVI